MKSAQLHNAIRTLLAMAAASGLAPYATAADEDLPPPPPAAEPGQPIEEIIVEGRQQSSAEQVLEERIKLDAVADIVSADQISRVGDSSVSLALRRLPAVTVVADQFIYVRGLGERYSSTTLNGAYVPSPDLTRNVIPLDLFPAEIVDSLTVQKGYSPDLPAAFGGGSVNVRTRAIPDEPLLSVQVGTGMNTDARDDGWTYRGGSDDELGTDDGTRALPREIRGAINEYLGDISPNGIFSGLRRQGGAPNFAQAEQLNRELATSLYRDLDLQRASLDPDLSLEGAAGNSWMLDEAGDWKFGVLAVADYKNQWRNRERINRSSADPENVSSETQRTTNTVSLTGSASAGLAYGDDHTVQAMALYLRNTDDEAALTLGNNTNFQQASGEQYRNYRVRFEERELDVLQFQGRHTLGSATRDLLGGQDALARLDGLQLDWYYSEATATTAIPTEATFSARDQVNPADGAVISTAIRASTSAADYRYTDLQDEVTSYGWNLSMPFESGNSKVELRGGYDYYEKGRSYLQTQLGLGTTASAALPALEGTPGQVFTDDKILDPTNGFILSLGGIGTESYLAAETINAGWGKVDWTWNDTWRVAAGARWEDFSQLSVPIDQYQFDPAIGIVSLTPEQLEQAATAEDDWYPSVAVTYMRDDLWAERFQLRFGWSLTTARPDLRELSGATYIDPITEARVRGNPDLVSSDLANFDLRAEWFFSTGDNLTASLFYKQIDQPIETVAAAGTDDNIALTFINADNADLYGIELEFLHGLGWTRPESDWANAFFVAGNVTLSDSKLEIGSAAPNLTSSERRLSQHAPWVVNLQLGFDAPNQRHSASLAYNASGERLFFAGRGGEPDAYEQPFHSVDLTYSYYPTDALSMKLRLQNLLDQKVVIAQGGVDVLEQSVGSTVKLDFTYAF
jgi:outer membrane receptor protein involved in Fe transport